jgi:signal peptidase I
LKTQVQTITHPPVTPANKQQALYHAMGFHTVWGQRLMMVSLPGVLGFLGFVPGLEKLCILSVFLVFLFIASLIEWLNRQFRNRAVVPRQPWWQRALYNIAIALLLALPLRAWVVQAFVINGKSVEPEIPPGSHMLVWKLSKSFTPGDIIAHRHADQVWVSRVVRVEGDAFIVQRNQWPEEKLPSKDVIGKVVSVYWRASSSKPAERAVAGLRSNPGPAILDLDKPPQLHFLEIYDNDDHADTPVHDVNGRLVGLSPDVYPVHASQGSKTTLSTRDGDDLFVRLWFEHRSWDEKSLLDVEVTLPDGSKLPVSERSFAGPSWTSGQTRPPAMSVAVCIGKRDHFPEAVRMKIRYAVGPWTEAHKLPASFHGSAALGENTLLGSLGTNNQGRTFINWMRSPGIQFDAVAMLKNGGKAESSGRSVSGLDADPLRLSESVEFGVPFTDVDAFHCRWRRMKEATYENIRLPTLHELAAQFALGKTRASLQHELNELRTQRGAISRTTLRDDPERLRLSQLIETAEKKLEGLPRLPDAGTSSNANQ